MIFTVFASCVAAVYIIGQPCPLWNDTEIRAHWANATVISLNGGQVAAELANETGHYPPGVTHMQLYMIARDYGTTTAATLAVDCWSGRIGLAFTDYVIGMDCSVGLVGAVLNDIDAMHAADSRTVKMRHLLGHLQGWIAGGRCRNWLADWPTAAALCFWLAIAGAFWAVRPFLPDAVQKATRLPYRNWGFPQWRAKDASLGRTEHKTS